MKFGDLFDIIGEGFRSIQRNSPKGGTESASAIDSKNTSIYKKEKEIESFANQIVKTEEKIRKLKQRGSEEDLKKIESAQKKIQKLTNQGIELDRQLEEVKKSLLEENEKLIESFESMRNNFARQDIFRDLSNEIKSQLDKVNEELRNGALTGADAYAKMNSLKSNQHLIENLENLQGGFSNISHGLKTMGLNKFESSVLSAGKSVGFTSIQMAVLKVAFDAFIDILSAAWDQIMRMSESMVGLTRETGGMISNLSIGTDSVGNLNNGMGNLNTKLAMSNVSVDQFSGAISGLFSEGFGQVAGVTDDLKNSQAALLYFGETAAKMKKLWGVDMVGAVRELTLNYQQRIKESTKMVEETAIKAKSMGLDMGAAVKNLEQAAAMAGKYYFKSVENMQNLALMATKLGTNVSTMMSSLDGLSSITDLFTKQQSFAAMELGNTANSLAKIYALKQTGQADKAAKLMATNLAKDLLAKGMLGTPQGSVALEQSGFSQEMIQMVNKLGETAKRTGVSLDDIADPARAKMMTQLELKSAEASNRSIGEIFEMFKVSFFGLFIDPLTKVFEPLIKMILNSTLAIWSFIKPLIDFGISLAFLITGVDILIGVFNGVSEVFTKTFGFLSIIFEKFYALVGPYITELSTGFQDFGKWLGYAVGIISLVFVPVLLTSLWSFVAGIVTTVIPALMAFGTTLWTQISTMIPALATWVTSLWAGVMANLPAMFSLAAGFWVLLLPLLPLVIAIVAIGVAIWYFWDSIVAIGKAVWNFFDNLGPVGKIFVALISPIILVIDLFKALVKKFAWLFKGDSDASNTKAITSKTWDEMFAGGKIPDVGETGNNSGDSSYKQALNTVADLPTLRNKSKATDQNVRGGNSSENKGKNSSSSIINNVKVDGIFNNKQSIINAT